MAFAPALTPILLGTMVAGSVYQGIEGAKQQKAGLKSQEQAQAEARSSSLRQQREADEAENRLNARAPNILSILEGEQNRGRRGISSTMVTGGIEPASVPVRKPQLGGISLLGG